MQILHRFENLLKLFIQPGNFTLLYVAERIKHSQTILKIIYFNINKNSNVFVLFDIK